MAEISLLACSYVYIVKEFESFLDETHKSIEVGIVENLLASLSQFLGDAAYINNFYVPMCQ